MIFGKHINRYYLRFALLLIMGLAALVVVDYLQLIIRNLYQMADVARENFVYIPTGTSKITITDDSLSDITAYLEILEEYDTI